MLNANKSSQLCDGNYVPLKSRVGGGPQEVNELDRLFADILTADKQLCQFGDRGSS